MCKSYYCGKSSAGINNKSRMLHNLCNSPLNLPPIELKYEPILKSGSRNESNIEMIMRDHINNYNATDTYSSSDIKSRLRFKVLTPTTMDSRQAFLSKHNHNKTSVENAMKLHHEKTKLEKVIEQLEVRKLRLLEEIYDLQKEFEAQINLNKEIPI